MYVERAARSIEVLDRTLYLSLQISGLLNEFTQLQKNDLFIRTAVLDSSYGSVWRVTMDYTASKIYHMLVKDTPYTWENYPVYEKSRKEEYKSDKEKLKRLLLEKDPDIFVKAYDFYVVMSLINENVSNEISKNSCSSCGCGSGD